MNDYIPGETTIIKECEELAEALDEVLVEAKKKSPTNKTWVVDHLASAMRGVKNKFKAHLKEIKKKETVPIANIIELNNHGAMPTMLKHCVVAVQPKLKSQGKLESFIGAHNICFWSFGHHGLIKARTGEMTGRGALRERFHKSKDDPVRNGLKGGAKTAKYNEMYNKLFGKGRLWK